MKIPPSNQLSIKALIIYMIGSLLFLSSIELHIHTKEAATSASHGLSVSITSFSNDFSRTSTADEIEVSPDGMLNTPNSAPNLLAIFLLLVLVIAVFKQIIIPRIRTFHVPYELPFYGTPALRAPPQ